MFFLLLSGWHDGQEASGPCSSMMCFGHVLTLTRNFRCLMELNSSFQLHGQHQISKRAGLYQKSCALPWDCQIVLRLLSSIQRLPTTSNGFNRARPDSLQRPRHVHLKSSRWGAEKRKSDHSLVVRHPVASKSSKWGVERVGRVGEYFPVDGCLAEVLLSTLFKQDGTGIAGGIRAQQSDAGGQAILFSTYAKCLVTFYPGIQEHARRSQMVALQPRSRVERNSFAPTYRICFDLGTPWDALGRLGMWILWMRITWITWVCGSTWKHNRLLQWLLQCCLRPPSDSSLGYCQLVEVLLCSYEAPSKHEASTKQARSKQNMKQNSKMKTYED